MRRKNGKGLGGDEGWKVKRKEGEKKRKAAEKRGGS